MVLPGTLFEEFGFNYIGPIDGHDVDALVKTLANVRELKGPQFLHVVTRKGYGYPKAEEDPILYHGVAKFDPAVGYNLKPSSKPSYTQVFGDWLCDMAAKDSRIVGITPAMREGSGLVRFSQEFPHRYFDVGIAEQHAVTFAGGLACEGMKPVVAIYSTFLQRAYDQAIHDIALQNLPVVFAIDRAGIVGADGATHIGAFDLSYLRCLPNMTVMAPSDENECRQMLYTGCTLDSPSAIRYPRGSGRVPSSKPRCVRFRSAAASCGARASAGRTACDPRVRFDAASGAGSGGDAGCNRRQHALRQAARRGTHPEAGARARRAGHGRGERRRRRRRQRRVGTARGRRHHHADAAPGLPDRFIDHGDPAMLLAQVGLDGKGIAASIEAHFGQHKAEPRVKPAA
jgi:1-deoxy-D-xylulose-5-phosphate synthase